jgi:hypothetical protein
MITYLSLSNLHDQSGFCLQKMSKHQKKYQSIVFYFYYTVVLNEVGCSSNKMRNFSKK